MTRTIGLTSGKAALVDDEDYETLTSRKWQYSKGYAVSGSHNPANHVRMHRVILGLSRGDGITVDHINGNRLDNRKANLRVSNNSANQANRGAPSNNTSGYKGVTYHKRKRKWMACLEHMNKTYFLGYYENPESAALAYNRKAIEVFGPSAKPNLVSHA